ncbi:MAG: hypothetical protein R3F49_06255, partial [Planctomycetota bacterium]
MGFVLTLTSVAFTASAPSASCASAPSAACASPGQLAVAEVDRSSGGAIDARPTLVVRLDALDYDADTRPDFTGVLWGAPRDIGALAPYAVVESAGVEGAGVEGAGVEGAGVEVAVAAYVGLPVMADWSTPRAALGSALLALELRRGAAWPATLHGRVFLPDERAHRLVAHAFTLTTAGSPADAAPTDRAEFERARQRHFAWRLEHDLPGAAWWRHRSERPTSPEDGDEPTRQGERDGGIQSSFNLLTGGRAVSENLRLDDLVRAGGAAVASVPLGELEGIRTAELDWSAFPQSSDDGLDPLATYLPADQHAVFFPSFQALTRVVDELRTNGTPVLDALEPRAEDARVQARYEAQLALELDAAARLFGPQVVRSIALTGGDPYLRTGSDLALVFECAEPDAFEAFLFARIDARARARGVAF